MLLDFDMADLWENHLLILDRDGWFPFELLDLGIGEAIIAVISLEPGEAWGFMGANLVVRER